MQKVYPTLRNWYARYWWLAPLTIFVIWRILIEITGQISFFLHPDIIIPWKNAHPPLWARWDSAWYASIVNQGYHVGNAGEMSNVTFFPLFPLIWKITEILTPLKYFAAALAVSNIFTLLGFITFYRWAELQWNKHIARKTIIALAVFPTSFFFISAYSESTLFFLIAAILLLSQKRQWIYAAILAALASASRPVGICVWPLVLGLWWYGMRNKSKLTKEFFALLFIPPLGLIIFSIYLYIETGNALAWLTGQSAAGREFVLPTHLIYSYTKNILLRGEYWTKHLAEIAVLLFTISLLPTLKKLSPVYVFYTVLNFLPSLFSNTLTSVQRFAVVILPLFIAVALQKKLIYNLYCVISGILLIYSISRFIAFQWAG